MIYLTSILNGKNEEGAGSLIEYLLSCFTLCQRHNFFFSYTRIQNIGHCKHNQKLWDKQWNKYIKKCLLYDIKKLPKKVTRIKVFQIDNLLFTLPMWGKQNVCFDIGNMEKQHYKDISLMENIKPKLRQHYHESTLDMNCYFDSKKTNIAVHIRRFTETDCCRDERRELYLPGETFFLNVIKRLQGIVKTETIFHIYSQGSLSNFTEFQEIPNVQLHLDEHPVVSLHHMIKADILVMSKSAFSYVASIYSKGIKLMREKPIVPIISDINLIGSDGTSFSLD